MRYTTCPVPLHGTRLWGQAEADWITHILGRAVLCLSHSLRAAHRWSQSFMTPTFGELAKQGSYYSIAYRGMLGELVSAGRRAPLAPAAFAEVLRQKTFTSGADAEVVVEACELLAVSRTLDLDGEAAKRAARRYPGGGREGAVEERVRIRAQRDVRVERHRVVAQPHRPSEVVPPLPPQMVDVLVVYLVVAQPAIQGGVRPSPHEGAVTAAQR